MDEPARTLTRTRLDPTDELRDLWRRGQRPDVRQFLARAGDLAPSWVVDVLRADQELRWRAGEHVPAETYLEAFPTLSDDVERALALILGEFLLRAERGERPVLEEYVRRFPRYADRLRQQVERSAAPASSAVPNPATESPPSYPKELSTPPFSPGRDLLAWPLPAAHG